MFTMFFDRFMRVENIYSDFLILTATLVGYKEIIFTVLQLLGKPIKKLSYAFAKTLDFLLKHLKISASSMQLWLVQNSNQNLNSTYTGLSITIDRILVNAKALKRVWHKIIRFVSICNKEATSFLPV